MDPREVFTTYKLDTWNSTYLNIYGITSNGYKIGYQMSLCIEGGILTP